jgi:hypothetical protein
MSIGCFKVIDPRNPLREHPRGGPPAVQIEEEGKDTEKIVGKDPGTSRSGLRTIDHLKAYIDIDGSTEPLARLWAKGVRGERYLDPSRARTSAVAQARTLQIRRGIEF